MKHEKVTSNENKSNGAVLVGGTAIRCAGCPLIELCATRTPASGCENKARVNEKVVRRALEDDSVNIVTIHGGSTQNASKAERIRRLSVEAKQVAAQQEAKSRVQQSPVIQGTPSVSKNQPLKVSTLEKIVYELSRAISGAR